MESLESRTLLTIVVNPNYGLEPPLTDGGDRITNPPVYLIFWGSYWSGANNAYTQAVEEAAQSMVSSSFQNVLKQYGTSGAHIAGFAFDASNPVSGSFDSDGLNSEILKVMRTGQVPPSAPGSRAIYAVITAPGVMSSYFDFIGFNSTGTDTGGANVGEIWSYSGSGSQLSLDDFTETFTHELAECMTDPGGGGYEVLAGSDWTQVVSGEQIGDAEGEYYNFPDSNGIMVQSIWSAANQAWVTEDGAKQKFFLNPVWSVGDNFQYQYDLVLDADQPGSTVGTTTIGSDGLGDVLVTMNGESITFAATTIRKITLNTGGRNYSIGALPLGVTVKVNTNGGPSQFQIIPPTTPVISGLPITSPLKVRILDAQGNLVPGDNSYVTLSPSNEPANSLTGTLTVRAVNGVATFSDLTFIGAGSYTVDANAPNIPTFGSATFQILAPHLAFLQQPSDAVAGIAIPSFQVAVEDTLGEIMTSSTSTITLSIASGPKSGGLTGTITGIATAGVVTFDSAVLRLAGKYTLTATLNDPLIVALPGTSDPFAVSAGALAKLGFVQQPTNAVAGIAIGPAVTVAFEDAYGNVCTSNGDVTISVQAGPAGTSLSGGLTQPSAASVALFDDLSLTKAGTYKLTATSGGVSGQSASFTISAAAGAKLSFARQPTETIAGSFIAPNIIVEVDDAYGNLVNTDTSKIALQIASGPAGAYLGQTQANASAGQAVFRNVFLPRAGHYVLTATSAFYGSVQSAAFNVDAGTGTQLVVTQEPADSYTGRPLVAPVIVELHDSYNNATNIGASSVTAKILSGPAGATIGGAISVPLNAGVAYFGGMSFSKPGAYTLQFSDAVHTVSTTSFTLVAGPTHLAFGAQPVTVAAGHVFTPLTVLVEDATNHVSVLDNSLVTISIASGPAGAALGGTRQVQANKGVATFPDISATMAGAYTLSAIDTGLPKAVSKKLAVTPDKASSQLKIVGKPSPVLVGGTFVPQLVVDVVDRYGNLVTTDRSRVYVTVPAGSTGGTLTGTTNALVSKGVAKFTKITATGAGTYGFVVMDPTLGAQASASFSETITAGATNIITPRLQAFYLQGNPTVLAATFKSNAPLTLRFTNQAQIVDQDGVVLGSAAVASTGAVKFTLTNLTAGSYTCTVDYAGDANHAAATSSAFTLVLNAA